MSQYNFQYQSPSNNNNPLNSNSHCCCFRCPECSAIKPNQFIENSPIENNTNMPNQFSSTFNPRHPYSYNNSPNYMDSKKISYFLNPRTLNNTSKSKNTLFRTKTNLTNTINYNTTKYNNDKCYNSYLPESDLMFYSLGRRYLNNGKIVHFNSLNKTYKFNRSNSYSSKNRKLSYLNSENERLRKLLKKVPKHDKNCFSESFSSSVFDNFINNYTKASKSMMNIRKNNKMIFNSFNTGENRLIRSDVQNYNSFVMPVNDLSSTNKIFGKINF